MIWLIGRRCTHSNVFSRPVLILREAWPYFVVVSEDIIRTEARRELASVVEGAREMIWLIGRRGLRTVMCLADRYSGCLCNGFAVAWLREGVAIFCCGFHVSILWD